MYHRLTQDRIESYLFKGQIIIIYGARQVGKTTLVNNILNKFSNKKALILNGDDLDLQGRLIPKNYKYLQELIGNPDILVVDEAQKFKQIGLVLKILHDNNPTLQIIATGSSSFELSNKLSEPLTGRSLVFNLQPLSILETSQNKLEIDRNVAKQMIYGSYPNIYDLGNDDKIRYLENIKNQYLYQDILNIGIIKKPQVIQKLLQLVAYQIGNEVSLSELSKSLEIDKKTVENYLDILEKTFVIFSLSSFSKNLRSEVAKSNKIYFWDLGIRNSLISNFNELSIRPDLGGMWENFCIVERLKAQSFTGKFANPYFWRNYNQQEIDYIEEIDGTLKTFEFKYNSNKKAKIPSSFATNYPNHTFEVVNKDNFSNFILPG